MNAAEALRAARAAGVSVTVDGAYLVLDAAAPPPSSVLDMLARSKAGVIELLRPNQIPWTPQSWREFFGERAGIAEFDWGSSKVDAEAQAFAACIDEWLRQNPVHSPSDRCSHCGAGARSGDPLLPFGASIGTDALCHSKCGRAWHLARQAEAITAISSIDGLLPR
jgi:hypothetical protein